MIQQATFHNMPLAFASAKGAAEDGWIPLGRELQSISFRNHGQWTRDGTKATQV